MLKVQNNLKIPLSDLWVAALPVLVGVSLGAILLFLKPTYSLILLGVIIGAAAVIKRPELAIIAILAITVSIYEEGQIPGFDVGPLNLFVSDFIIIALVVALLARWISEPSFRFVRSPLSLPLATFFLIAMFATGLGFLKDPASANSIRDWFQNPPAYIQLSIPEIRVITYYMLFFLVINFVRTKSQIRVLLYGMLFLTILVVASMVIQITFGSTVQLLQGRVETLVTAQSEYYGITRITAFSGENMLLFSLFLSTALLVKEKFPLLRYMKFALWVIYLVGILITFSRSLWASYSIGLFILLLVLEGEERRQYVRFIMLVTIVGVFAIGLAYVFEVDTVTNFLNASLDRFVTLLNPETYQSTQMDTLRWRDFEYKWGFIQVVEHPFFGIGLGAPYRPWLPWIDWAGFDGRTFVHNGHLWMLMKTGGFGYLAFLWFSSAFLIRGFTRVRLIKSDTDKAIVIGCLLTYIAFLIASVAAPVIMLFNATPVIGVMTGLAESMLQSETTAKNPPLKSVS